MNNFREYITSNNLTQVQVARTLGITAPHLNDILAGRRFASRKLAARIEVYTRRKVLARDILGV